MKVPAELRETIADRVNLRRESLAEVVTWLASAYGIEVSRMAVSKIAARYRQGDAMPLRPPPRPKCPTCGRSMPTETKSTTAEVPCSVPPGRIQKKEAP